MNEFLEFLDTLQTAIREALRLNPRVFELVQQGRSPLFVTVLIAILGGASQLVGQSIILFVNRVTPTRFLFSLLFNGLLYTGGLFFWALAIWGAGQLLFPNDIPFMTIAQMIGLGATPHLFGFLVLTPYAGTLIGRILSAWSFLIVLSGIAFLAGGNLLIAVLSVGAGWLLMNAVNATIGKPFMSLRRRLFRTVASAAMDMRVADILPAPPNPLPVGEEQP